MKKIKDTFELTCRITQEQEKGYIGIQITIPLSKTNPVIFELTDVNLDNGQYSRNN